MIKKSELFSDSRRGKRKSNSKLICGVFVGRVGWYLWRMVQGRCSRSGGSRCRWACFEASGAARLCASSCRFRTATAAWAVPHYPRSPTTIWPLLSTVSPERSSSSRSPTPICPDSGIPLQQTWNYTIPALFRNQSYVRHGIKLINLVYQRGPVAPDFPFKCWNVKFVFFDVELGTWINGNDCSVSCKNSKSSTTSCVAREGCVVLRQMLRLKEIGARLSLWVFIRIDMRNVRQNISENNEPLCLKLAKNTAWTRQMLNEAML